MLGTEKLSEQFRTLLREGVVSEKQTRAVQRLEDAIQDELASRIADGRLLPAELDQAARSVADAGSISEAVALLDLAQAVDKDPAMTKLFQSTGRQMRRLTRSLVELRGQALSDDLRRDLKSLRRDIDDLLN